MTTCALCDAADCVELRAHPQDSCPVYYRLRDALLPLGGDLPPVPALALFWLARELGRVEPVERMRLTAELAELFDHARLEAARNATGGELH
jgi:hypothetical protein